jgi:SAM-dependent methyltransferase
LGWQNEEAWLPFSYITGLMDRLEGDASVKTRDAAFRRLRILGLDDFGEVLLGMPSAAHPKLSSLLPSMASDEIQDGWTGNHGLPLLTQSGAFVRSLAFNFSRFTGRSIQEARILDYGCGYGRLARLMYYFVDTPALVGVDPYDQSIEECRSAGLGPRFLLSDYLPTRLPTSIRFNLAYAFSVFTHTSKRATLAALGAIRAQMSPGGVLCLTIRPLEYWEVPRDDIPPETRTACREEHLRDGFAFCPHNRTPIDGDITYGDTTMTLDWLDSHAVGWRRLGIDRSLDDPWQIYVFLQVEPAWRRRFRRR